MVGKGGGRLRRANDGVISSMDTSSFLLLHSFSFDEIEAWVRRCRAPFFSSFLLLFLSRFLIHTAREPRLDTLSACRPKREI